MLPFLMLPFYEVTFLYRRGHKVQGNGPGALFLATVALCLTALNAPQDKPQ